MFQGVDQQNESAGVGIGLSTAHTLANSLGGSINIISPLVLYEVVNKGTEVSFDIKCAKNKDTTEFKQLILTNYKPLIINSKVSNERECLPAVKELPPLEFYSSTSERSGDNEGSDSGE
jgi:hypothetical protein